MNEDDIRFKVAGEKGLHRFVGVNSFLQTGHVVWQTTTLLDISQVDVDIGRIPLLMREEVAAVNVDQRPRRGQLETECRLFRLAPLDQNSDPAREDQGRNGLRSTRNVADDLSDQVSRVHAVGAGNDLEEVRQDRYL